MKDRLIIFTRYPEPGTTKTRMIPELGPEGAADLQRAMTQHTVEVAQTFAEEHDLLIEVRYAGGDDLLMHEWLGDKLEYNVQGEGDLGKRMDRAFQHAFDKGADRVVTIGTDCPDLTVEILTDAFNRLSEKTGTDASEAIEGVSASGGCATEDGSVPAFSLVLGPAEDGGYYLIGLTRPIPELFTEIAWGGETVREQTLKKAEALGISVAMLPLLADVDRPADLHLWRKAGPPRISVIVPALDEAACIGETLAAAKRGRNIELIVADGGSTDGTKDIARSHNAIIVDDGRGRARQANEGAQQATGDILLFVHADTILPDGYDAQVRETLRSSETAAGAFKFQLDTSSPSLSIITWFTNWRSRALQMPYGDQTLFMKKETFEAVNGYPEIPIMDDLEIIRRLRKLGRIVTLPAPAITSARRWRDKGAWRTTLLHLMIVVAYHLGVSPTRLARWRGEKHNVTPAP